MVTREEKARQLLHAMTEIDDRYIAEAAPENTEHSAALEGAVKTETVVSIKQADVEKTKTDVQKDAKESAKTDVPDEDHHSEPKVLYKAAEAMEADGDHRRRCGPRDRIRSVYEDRKSK